MVLYPEKVFMDYLQQIKSYRKQTKRNPRFFMKEKDYRIRKFNSGAGAILCNGCNVIVMDGFIEFLESSFAPSFCTFNRITKEDWDSTEPVYCESCKMKMGKDK